jgi:hypothetical protein
LGFPGGDADQLTVARYTGQEGAATRENIAANPPDILLTNFMMLELILTRFEPGIGVSCSTVKVCLFSFLTSSTRTAGGKAPMLLCWCVDFANDSAGPRESCRATNRREGHGQRRAVERTWMRQENPARAEKLRGVCQRTLPGDILFASRSPRAKVSKMPDGWKDHDRYKVAEMLLNEFQHLSLNQLVAAIRDCDFQVKPHEGWNALAECARAYLKNSGGSGAQKGPG